MRSAERFISGSSYRTAPAATAGAMTGSSTFHSSLGNSVLALPASSGPILVFMEKLGKKRQARSQGKMFCKKEIFME